MMCLDLNFTAYVSLRGMVIVQLGEHREPEEGAENFSFYSSSKCYLSMLH